MNFNASGWIAELLDLKVRESMAVAMQEVADHARMWTVTAEMIMDWQDDLDQQDALARWADDGGA